MFPLIKSVNPVIIRTHQLLIFLQKFFIYFLILCLPIYFAYQYLFPYLNTLDTVLLMKFFS